MPNRLLLAAAESRRLERVASTSRLTRPIVARYVAGTTLVEALEVTEELTGAGLDVSLDLLGESVTALDQSEVATQEYLHAIQGLQGPPARSQGCTVSVKLSHLWCAW